LAVFNRVHAPSKLSAPVLFLRHNIAYLNTGNGHTALALYIATGANNIANIWHAWNFAAKWAW
jgi:hypothetical protein